jgi:hypothetical protein
MFNAKPNPPGWDAAEARQSTPKLEDSSLCALIEQLAAGAALPKLLLPHRHVFEDPFAPALSEREVGCEADLCAGLVPLPVKDGTARVVPGLSAASYAAMLRCW